MTQRSIKWDLDYFSSEKRRKQSGIQDVPKIVNKFGKNGSALKSDELKIISWWIEKA